MKNACADRLGGFTLIELLVVVLIIGVLAAVAVPQYEVAVERARASNVMALGRAIRDAEEVYYLANGNYTKDLDSLDVEVSLPKGFTMVLMENNEYKVTFKRQGARFRYDILFNFEYRKQFNEVRAYCWASSATPDAVRICKTFGREYKADSSGRRFEIF